MLRQHELAEALSVTPRTINRWMKAKLLPYIKVGKTVIFDVDEVITALSKFKREAGLK